MEEKKEVKTPENVEAKEKFPKWIFIVLGVIFVFVLGYNLIKENIGDWRSDRAEKRIEKLIREENFSEAYTETKNLIGGQDDAIARILKAEIATLVSESDGKSNLPKIIYVINERCDDRHPWSEPKSEGMYDFAIDLAESIDNMDLFDGLLEAKLKKSVQLDK